MMETDCRYMRATTTAIRSLLDWCQNNDVPFLRIERFGLRRHRISRRARARSPLNVYAYSKCLFDQYARRVLADRTAQVVGFRYFNVYGMREQHKNRMASVVWHFFNQYRADHYVRLFEGSAGCAAGEQRRDLYRSTMWSKSTRSITRQERCVQSRTGTAATLDQVAAATIMPVAWLPAKRLDVVGAGRCGLDRIRALPPALVGNTNTEADLTRLRDAGYRAPMDG
jgi:ADP-L-glycero-D-manno-heptose 6-epimerase